MIIQARFGAAQTGLAYQFYDAAGTLLGSAVNTGITALPEGGGYIANATVPSGAVGVYWSSTASEATEDLREALAPAPDNTEVLAAIAELPTEAEIIAAAGGLTAETVEKLEAADQILIAELHSPSETPVVIIPAASDDPDLCQVFYDSELGTGVALPGLKVTFELLGPMPQKSSSGKFVVNQAVEKATDQTGRVLVSLEKGLRWKANCLKLFGKNGKTFTVPNAESINLNTY